MFSIQCIDPRFTFTMAKPTNDSPAGAYPEDHEVSDRMSVGSSIAPVERDDTPVLPVPGREKMIEVEEVPAVAATSKGSHGRQSLVVGDLATAPEFIALIKENSIDRILSWDHNTLFKAVKQAAHTVEDWEGVIVDQQEEIRKLKEELEELHQTVGIERAAYALEMRKNLALSQRLDRLIDALPTVGTHHDTEHRHGKAEKSTKLPHPWEFDGSKEMRPTFDAWLSKLKSKLERNRDHYPTDADQMAYVETRVSGLAHKHLAPRMKEGASNQFQTAKEMLETLTQAYGDPDPKATARAKLAKLYQGTTPFVDFWCEFQEIQAELDQDEETRMEEVRCRISPELMAAVVSVHATTAEELAKECLIIDRRLQRVTEAKKKMTRFASAKDYAAKQTFNTRSTGSVPTSVPSTATTAGSASTTTIRTREGHRRQETPAERAARLSATTCYKCTKKGHLARDCPDAVAEVKEAAKAKGRVEFAASDPEN